MIECVACGTDLSGVTHRCRYCEEPVCPDHRLPENHNCVYQSMADAPSTKGVTDTATESSTWAGIRDVLAGNLPGKGSDSSENADNKTESARESSTQTKTPPRKDTDDPERATWGSSGMPPNRTGTYPDDDVSKGQPAEAATSRAPGARRDEPTAKSPDVETKDPDDTGHEWPTENDSDYPTPGRIWRAIAFILKLTVIGGIGYGAAWYLGFV